MLRRASRLSLWFMAAGLIVTGLALWWMRPATPDEFPHPWTGAMRAWHGAFMMAALVQFGYMLAEHIAPRLRAWRRNWDGLLHLVLWLLLGISGFFLYYPSEALDALLPMGDVHLAAGCGLGLFFPLHVGRWLKRRRRARLPVLFRSASRGLDG
ncbi:MAG: hypothetical protein HYV16_03535 [Gammaproteobacteria bacterium]|nr:hypothetical protein [Gammaproteobacteria bacterium]